MKELVCELCKRSGVPKLTEHHLIPREEIRKLHCYVKTVINKFMPYILIRNLP